MQNAQSIAPSFPPVASPQVWQLSDRLDWALSLPVPPPARFVAVALIKHTNSVTGLTCPAVSTLVTLTGYSKATVKTAIRQLEQGGHYDITRLKVGKVNAANRYRANRGGVGQELTQGGAGADPEPVREPVREVQRTVGKPTNFPSKRAGQTQQQRLVAAVCGKLGFSVTFAGLEEFAEREHTAKQTLITRLLKAEAWHDSRVSRTRSGTAELVPAANAAPASKKPKKTKGKKKPSAANAARSGRDGATFPAVGRSPRSGRLLAEYAERLRVARKYQRSDGSWANLSGGAV